MRPVLDFADLESRLRETFAKANEMFELGYLFANWDIETWFKELEFEPDKNFHGYSFDHVFQYQYVGEALWQHGGVQVTCKDQMANTSLASSKPRATYCTTRTRRTRPIGRA